MIYNSFALFGEYFSMAWVAIKTNKLRSFLTTLGIFIGVTTIITIWTTIQGLNNYIHNTFSDIGSAKVYVQKFPWIITDDFWKYRNRQDITWKEFQAVQRYSTLADLVTPQVVSNKLIGYKETKFENTPVLGTTESFFEMNDLAPNAGRIFTELEVSNNVRTCVLGAELASKLYEEKNPVGTRIKIDGLKYRVIGVLERQGEFFGQSRDNYAIVPIGTFRGVFGMHRGLQIAVSTNNSERFDDLKEELRGILRRERKVKPDQEDDFALNELTQLTSFYDNATSMLYGIIIVIATISLLVGGIGITNIMLVSVTERTREIGIRKAVGAKNKNVLSQFLLEATAISSIGGFIGIGFGIIFGSLILNMMNVTEGVGLSSVLVGFGFSAFVGIISGFYPAYKAAKLNPIDSLRYE
jgi:putative ABC transport system permease protein